MATLEILFENDIFALFAVIGSGLLLGQVTVAGLSLGTSAVLFTALLAGHFGVELAPALGKIGLVLFVYCVGVGAGGRFFRSLAREGSQLAKLSLVITITAALITWCFATALDMPPDLATGIFAGALTSTPALAGADEALRALGDSSALVIGYGIAYPFGVIGVVLFVQVLPGILKWKLNAPTSDAQSPQITNALVKVSNPNLFGRRIWDTNVTERHGFQISRVLRQGRLEPLSERDEFEDQQRLLIVGEPEEIELAIEHIGQRVTDGEQYAFDTSREQRKLLVTSPEFAGRSIRDLNSLSQHGVVITRITRLGLTFVPRGSTIVEKHDLLTTVGTETCLASFAEAIGHRETQIGITDLLSLSMGIAAGVFLGMLPIALPGGSPITLGMAGGPMIAGLLLGHFGKVGGIVGHIPRPTRMLLQELGLVLFLADAGIKGGGQLAETVSEYGLVVFLMGVAVTILPMLLALPIARKWLNLSELQTLGGVCGGMTSTPALGALTAKTDSQLPIVSYAAAYPVALVIMTILAKLIVVALAPALS